MDAPCDAATDTYTVIDPAPGFVLVFLNGKAYTDSTSSDEIITFTTGPHQDHQHGYDRPAGVGDLERTQRKGLYDPAQHE